MPRCRATPKRCECLHGDGARWLMPVLADRRPARLLRRVRTSCTGFRSRSPEGRGRRHHRPQRRRQDHDDARDHGIARPPSGLDQASRGTETIAALPETIARLGVGLCAGRARHLCEPRCHRKPAAAAAVSQLAARASTTSIRLFPNLRERRRSQGTRLSGGEQQMLAIASRAAHRRRRLPARRADRRPCTGHRRADLRASSRRHEAEGPHASFSSSRISTFASQLADRHYVMEHGRIVDVIARNELDDASRPHQILAGDLRGRTGHPRFRATAGRPHQRLVLRHDEPRACDHLRTARHRQHRAGRLLHDGRVLQPGCCCAGSASAISPR